MLIVIHHPEIAITDSVCSDVLAQAVYQVTNVTDSSRHEFKQLIESEHFSVFELDCDPFTERRSPVVIGVVTKPFLPASDLPAYANKVYVANVQRRSYELGQYIAALYSECMCGIAPLSTHDFKMYNMEYANLFMVSGPAPDESIDYLQSIKFAISTRESAMQRSANENHLDS